MKKIITAILAVIIITPLTANKLYIREYPFMRHAKLKGTPGNIAAIPFDNKLYKNTNPYYSNIRIIDKKGSNVPFSVKNVYPMEQKTLYPIHRNLIRNVQYDNKQKEVSADIVFDVPMEVSRLTFPEKPSGKITLVFYDGSDKKIREDDNILLKRNEDGSKTSDFDFSPVRVKRIHVTMKVSGAEEKKTAEQFFNTIQAKQAVSVKTPGKPVIKNVNLPEISLVNKGNLTEITVDASKTPCSELEIKSDDKQFKRYVEVFSVDKGKEKCIASWNLTQKNDKIQLPEVRSDWYIIRIHNAGENPLKNIRLQWKAKERVLMFIPPEQGDVRIYYGGNSKQRLYDIEYAERYGLPPQIYELEEETDSPDFEPVIPSIDLLKYLMWVLLVIAATLLFIGIVRQLNKEADIDNSSGK